MPRPVTGKTAHGRDLHPGRYDGAVSGRENGGLVYVRAGFGSAAIGYLRAWDLQRALHERRVSGEIPDSCLLLEHQPVYTAGKRTEPLDRPVGDPGAPVIEVDRGGKITWHGPGQLVGYPIVALGEPVDVIAYVRKIEEAIIGVCADFGVATTRVAGRSGVWIPGEPGGSPAAALDRKVGAIGIRIARGVTMHGFALNCDCDLSWYDRIAPCGIRDAAVTTLSAEAGRPIRVADVLDSTQRHLAQALGARSWRTIEGPAELLGQARAGRPVPVS
jgi:lipoyl(octanoyl) transferase